MHAGFQELLAMRDGAPLDRAIEEHVATCTHCSHELTRLAGIKHDLRQLPPFEPIPWSSMRRRLDGTRGPRSRRAWPPLLAAGSLAAAVALAFVVRGAYEAHRAIEVATRTGSPASRMPPLPQIVHKTPTVASTASPAGETMGLLISRSQRLESLLRTLPPRPGVQRAATSAAIDTLQIRIQYVDLQLSSAAGMDPEQARHLWSTRVQLLNSLVDVRYAEAARSGRGLEDFQESGVI